MQNISWYVTGDFPFFLNITPIRTLQNDIAEAFAKNNHERDMDITVKLMLHRAAICKESVSTQNFRPHLFGIPNKD